MSRFATMTDAEIREHRESVLLRLLLRVAQIETNELVQRLHELGHASVQPGHVGVLANIDTEGTRIAGIAARLGVTRQAASQMVAELERRGWVERTPDPKDGRAVLARHTANGRRLLTDALEQMDEIERHYASVIGPRRFDGLKKALRTIADAADPASALGR